MKILSMAVLALLLLSAMQARGAVPEMVNYQGFLRNDDGTPVDGTVDMRFSVFTQQTGGSLIWTEVHQNVSVDEGLFHVLLGTTTPLTESMFSGAERWLETSLSGETPFARRQFLSTPYAFHASVADVALSGGEGDDDWTISGSNVYKTTGKVGIGTSSFGGQLLYVASDVVLGGGVNATADGEVEWISLEGESANWVLGVQNETTEAASDFYIGLDPNIEDGVFHIERDGDVGIGTTSPQSRLTVAGDVDADSFEATAPLGSSTQPAEGGVYSDNVVYAWAKIRSDGVILDSFGVSSVNHFSTGDYDVILERELPAGICATVTPWAVNDPVLASASTSSDRVTVKTRLFIPGNHNFSLFDYGFYVQVVGRPS